MVCCGSCWYLATASTAPTAAAADSYLRPGDFGKHFVHIIGADPIIAGSRSPLPATDAFGDDLAKNNGSLKV